MNTQSNNLIDKKNAIIETALTLISEHGFHGTPMSMIAKKANVAIGTIYHYFDSKDILIQELYIYTKDKLANVSTANYSDIRDFETRFIEHWLAQFDFFWEHPTYLSFFEQFGNSPFASCSRITDTVRDNKLSSFLCLGIEQKTIQDLDKYMLIPIAYGSLVSCLKMQLNGKKIYTREELTKIALMIWNGIKCSI